MISIGDAIKIIDFINGQVKGKKKSQHNLFKEVVEPVFSNFEKVHDNYCETFCKYRALINSSHSLSFLIQEIEQDVLSHQHLRNKLETSLITKQDSLSEFFSAIYHYLEFPYILLNKTTQPWSNIRRDSLIEILVGINGLTPEIIIGSGLLNEIRNFSQNQKTRSRQSIRDSLSELVSRLVLAIRYPNSEFSLTNISEVEATQNRENLNSIKLYLAIQCIEFVFQETQEQHRLVTAHYYQFKYTLT